MADAEIKLIINSPQGLIPLRSLADASKKIFEILLNVDRQISGGKVTTGWAVKHLKMESPAELLIVPLEPTITSAPEAIINNSIKGINLLTRTAKRPRFFNDSALEKSRELVKLIDIKNIDSIRIENGSKSTSLGYGIVDNVNSLVRKIKEKPIGAIEGRLDMIDIHSGLQIGIYRLLDDRKIRAKFDLEENSEMYSRAKKLLGKRIYAMGEIKRNKEGEPIEIKIEKLEEIDESNLSNIEDIFGLDPDFTGDKSVDEFLREQRDDD